MKKSRAVECEEKRIYWEEMVSRWETSELSQIEFCRRNKFNRHRFNLYETLLFLRVAPAANLGYRQVGNSLFSLGCLAFVNFLAENGSAWFNTFLYT